MKVSNILINNLEKPFGFSFSNVNINIKFAEADSYEKYDLELEENGSIIFTQKNNNVTTTNIDTKVGTKAKSEYRVIIKQNDQVVCTSSFESGYGEEGRKEESACRKGERRERRSLSEHFPVLVQKAANTEDRARLQQVLARHLSSP